MKIKATLSEISIYSPRLNTQITEDWRTEQYEKRFLNGEIPPPILVARDKGGIFVLDGFHRLKMARRVGLDKISAWVIDWKSFQKLLKAKFHYGGLKSLKCYRDLDDYIMCGSLSYFDIRMNQEVSVKPL